jgi:RNA polymerase I-specific transcription initiation factor RRN7
LVVDIYIAVQRMAKALDMDFSFPSIIARHRVVAYPEIRLISLVIIATKLSQPFDDVERFPERITDPTALSIDWDIWLDVMKEHPTEGIKRGDEMGVNNEEALRMNEAELDGYMDWLQNTLIGDRDPKFPRSILDLYPLEEVSSKSDLDMQTAGVHDELVAERVKNVHENMIWHKPVAIDDGLNDLNRPGSSYRYYRRVEDLSGKARAFYEKAAENAGLSLDMLCHAVFLIERKLQQWIMAEKRRLVEEEYQMDDDINNHEEIE